MERNSRKIIRRLKADGWVLVRVSGDHHVFQHPRKGTIVLTHPVKDMSPGLVRAIYRQAGWR
ncbi:MAG: type II toxin-antitoxin system HicA family toxin [Hyphomicrobiales bacterium]